MFGGAENDVLTIPLKDTLKTWVKVAGFLSLRYIPGRKFQDQETIADRVSAALTVIITGIYDEKKAAGN